MKIFCFLFALLLASLVSGQAVDGEVINGQGSSFAAPIYKDWTFYYRFVDSASRITYTASSSGAGRRAIIARTVDFAGSDVPLNADEKFVADGGVITFPTIVAAIGIAYNPLLPRGLVIPRPVLARIFGPGATARTPFWNDPEIAAANPTVASRLPAARMVLVARTGTSGTTEAFKIGMKKIGGANYLGDIKDTATWAVNPADIVFPGSSPLNVLAYIAANPYTLGIASQADINTFSVNTVSILNTAGKVLTSTNLALVTKAASLATINDDLSIDSIDPDPAALAWPLTTPTYVLMEKTSSKPTCEIQRDLTKFWLWTQTNPLAIEVAQTVGVTTPYKVLRRVMALLNLGTFCSNGDLASDGVGHAAIPVSQDIIRPMARIRSVYSALSSSRPVVVVPGDSTEPERLFRSGAANFALVDAPLERKADDGIIQVPFMSTGIVVAYNVTALVGKTKVSGGPLDPLVLSLQALAGIFSGTIKTWNDPVILRDNREALLYLPAKPIVVIVPDHASHVTDTFAAALAAANGNAFTPGVSTEPTWPASFMAVAKNSSDALGLLASSDNSITFATSSAIPDQPTFAIASSQTALGKVVKPGSVTYKVAHDAAFSSAQTVSRIQAGEAITISYLPVDNAWPIMAITYLAAKRDVTSDCAVHSWDASVANWLFSSREAAKAISSLPEFFVTPRSLTGHILLELSKVTCGGQAVALTAAATTCPVARGSLCGGRDFGQCAIKDDKSKDGEVGATMVACACVPGQAGDSCQDVAPAAASTQTRNIIIGVVAGSVVLIVAVIVWVLNRRAAHRPPVWMVSRRDFSLDDLIARGGFSLVFRATWKNTVVSAKVLRLPSKRRGYTSESSSGIVIEDVILESDPVARVLRAETGLQTSMMSAAMPSSDNMQPLGGSKSNLYAVPKKAKPSQVLPGQVADEVSGLLLQQGGTRSTTLNPPKKRGNQALLKPMAANAAKKGSSGGNNGEEKILAGARSELEIIAKLRHPNVAFLIAAAVDRGYLFLLLEHMDAGSLYDVLRNEMLDLGPGVRVHMALDAAKGLLFLHSQSPPVLHRDIKSPNILVDSRFAAKVTDFGLSSVTASVAKEGTLPWSAPEVIRGEVYTLKSDVFSFGVLLWEIQCSRAATPWADMDVSDVRRQVLAGFRPELVESPTNLLGLEYARLVKQCWAQSPDDRPTMAAVVAKLEEIKADVATLEHALAKDGRRQLLHLEIPNSMREDIMAGREITPVPLDDVTLIFTDIVGFTKWSSSHTAEEVTAMLAELHDGLFAAICIEHSVHHLETIGDAFIAVTNFPRIGDPAAATRSACAAGLAMIEAAKKINMSIRVGIAAGPAVATIVGKVSPKITLLGDTVNLASRLESTAPAGCVQVSRSVCAAVARTGCRFKEGKIVELKGKGPTKTYILESVGTFDPAAHQTQSRRQSTYGDMISSQGSIYEA